MKKDTTKLSGGGDVSLKTNCAKLLPKTAAEITNGGLYRQAIRCGKKTCRCAAGSLHEGYYYFIRRVNGRLRKSYVPKQHARRLNLLIQDAKRNRQIDRATRLSNRALLSELRARLHEYDQTIRNLAAALRQDD